MADPSKDTWSAVEYNDTASFVYSDRFTAPILSLLDARPGERILDFGCGSGQVTLHIQELVGKTGTVVGFDSSQSMIEQAVVNGLPHAFVSDARNLRFPAGWPTELQKDFDAVFSNATLHWCKNNPEGVLDSAKRVLKPGGRFVVEMGGFMNCIAVRSAMHSVLRAKGYEPAKLDPWFFPSVEHYKTLLERNGFRVHSIGIHPRMTPLKGSLRDWLHLFCRPYFLHDMGDEEAEAVMRSVEDICSIDCRDEYGKWSIMYTRLRVVATRD